MGYRKRAAMVTKVVKLSALEIIRKYNLYGQTNIKDLRFANHFSVLKILYNLKCML